MEPRARRRDEGFTLIELMIAVSIIGVLAAVAIPSFRTYQWKAKRSEAYVNLGSLATTQKAYFAISEAFLGVAPAEPGTTDSNVPTSVPRDSGAVRTAFSVLGWAAEGQVYFDYDTNSPNLGLGCVCVQCFTSTAYGDIDGDGRLSSVMYVHPGSVGGTCASSMFGYTAPVDAASQPIYDEVALNQANDDF